MKTILISIIFCFCSIIYGQSTPKEMPEKADSVLNIGTVIQGPIYPGCKKHKGDNRELYQCFNREFQTNINNLINKTPLNITGYVRVIASFKITKNGEIILQEVKCNRVKNVADCQNMTKAVSNAFQVLNEYHQKSKSKAIIPAINESGESTTMRYAIPIGFRP